MNPFEQLIVDMIKPPIVGKITSKLRRTYVENILRRGFLLGIRPPSARTALSTLRRYGLGIRISDFYQMWWEIPRGGVKLMKQRQRDPFSVIPRSEMPVDFRLRRNRYKYMVGLQARYPYMPEGEFEERYYTLVSGERLSMRQALERFREKFGDKFPAGQVDWDSLRFIGAWRRSENMGGS